MSRVHELAITTAIVEAIRERLPDARVVRVKLQIGKLAAIDPEALKFSFDVCTDGTLLSGAQLEIDELEGRELLIHQVEVA